MKIEKMFRQFSIFKFNEDYRQKNTSFYSINFDNSLKSSIKRHPFVLLHKSSSIIKKLQSKLVKTFFALIFRSLIFHTVKK